MDTVRGLGAFMMTRWLLGAGAYLVCGLGTLSVNAQGFCNCPKIKIQFSTAAIKLESADEANPGPRLDVSPATKRGSNTVRVLAIGPVVDAMVSPNVKAHVKCITGGAQLTVTLSRSRHYGEATGENQLWRPRIAIELSVEKSESQLLRATWTMRQERSNDEVSHSRTPPYPEQPYPKSVEIIVPPQL